MTINVLGYTKSAERWQKYGETYRNEARTYYVELNKSCLTIATFLIGFVGVFLQLNHVAYEPIFHRLLLTVAFICPTISIAFGIIMFFQANKFLNRAGNYYEQLSENMHLWILETGNNCGKEYPKEIFQGLKLEEKASALLSYAQLTFLATGFLGICLYFILQIFQSPQLPQ